MFDRGERVYWNSHGIRRLGIVEDSPPAGLKARVRPEAAAAAAAEGVSLQLELPIRRLFRAPPELEGAERFLLRDHATRLEEAAVDLEKREASFVASDGSVDRFGDILEPAGWDLKAFRRNPVFLWQHDNAAPIGTVPSIHVKDDRLVARARFMEGGIMPLADQLFRLVAAGYLCAVSIGARALDEPEPILDAKDNLTGFKYGAMELLELSLVSVPANPNALLLGRSFGIEEDLLSEAFESDASVANLDAYFDRLRASVPGLLPPRPAKPSQGANPSSTFPERNHETHFGPTHRARQATRCQSGSPRGPTRESGERKPRTE